MFELLPYVAVFAVGFFTHKAVAQRTQALVAAIQADVKVHVDRVVTELKTKL